MKFRLLIQIGIVFGVCLIGEGVSLLLPFAFPGSVISMILLFFLLLCKVIKVEHIKQKADFLLKNMAFFFIPAGVSIIDQVPFIKDSVLPLLLICFITTILTFFATAMTVRGVVWLQNRLKKKEGKDDE